MKELEQPSENLKDRNGKWSILILFGRNNSFLVEQKHSTWFQRSTPGSRDEKEIKMCCVHVPTMNMIIMY